MTSRPSRRLPSSGSERLKDIFLLDVDDTLLDFRRAERANLKKSLEEAGVEADERLLARFHEINDALWKALERGEIDRESLKTERFGRLFREFGILCDPKIAARNYWENFPAISFPFAGAREFLAELSRRGRVYLVTNGGATIQDRHIADAGFLPFLSGVFISEKIGFDKPSLGFARFVEEKIENYKRERAVWIGDSLTSDGECAKNAGIDFLLFAPDGAPAGYAGAWAGDYAQILADLFGE